MTLEPIFSPIVSFDQQSERLEISYKQMEKYFEKSVYGSVEHLKAIIADCKDIQIETMILSGGYANSPYLRKKIRKYFPKYKMSVSRDPDLAVVKGAVFMGWDRSSNIIIRAASYSYGFSLKQGRQRQKLLKKVKTLKGGMYSNTLSLTEL